MKSGEHGLITGFGENNQLQRLNMTTLDFHGCLEKSLDKSYIVADDKFCIYSNEGGAICRGDSGGGFFQGKQSEDLQITFSLLGVISNTPTTTNDCTRPDNDSYVAITNLQYMADDFKVKLKAAIKEDQSIF